MFFTQGPLSVGESFGVERRLLRLCFTQIETAAHHSLFVPTANLWYDIRDTYIVRFVADGCRKNLPLGDSIYCDFDPYPMPRMQLGR